MFRTLLDKLEVQREALGDQVFDVLGQVLTGSDLNELLTRAIRYGDQPQVRARLHQVVDEKLGSDLAAAVELRRRHLSDLTDADLRQARRAMALAAAGTLQPHVVEPFVREALPQTRTEIAQVSDGVYVVPRVSGELRQSGDARRQVERRYDLVTFDPAAIGSAGRAPAELLGPGHPLVDALADMVHGKSGHVLRQGLVLSDDRACAASLLVLLRQVVQSSAGSSEELACLSVHDDGTVQEVAAQALALLAPAELGLRPTRDELQRRLRLAQEHAAGPLTEAHVQRVQQVARVQRAAGLEQARQRLSAEAERVAAERDALLRKEAADAGAVSGFDRVLEDLRARKAAREAAALVDDDLIPSPPEVIAVAWVHGTSTAAEVAAREAAVARVAAALGEQGDVERAPRFAGYDLLVTPAEGSPRFVAVKAATAEGDLTAAEAHVRRNVGTLFSLAVVGDEEVAWREC